MEQEDFAVNVGSVDGVSYPVGYGSVFHSNRDLQTGFVRVLFPAFNEWRDILDRLNVDVEAAVQIAARATANGTDFQSELLMSGLVAEKDLYAEIAAHLGLPFIDEVDPNRLIIGQSDIWTYLNGRDRFPTAKLARRDGSVALLIAPERLGLAALRRLVWRRHSLIRHLHVTSPATLRRALIDRARSSLSANATGALFESMPRCSARIVIDGRQGVVLGMLMVLMMLAISLRPFEAFLSLHVVSSVFYLGCVGLRFAATRRTAATPPSDLGRVLPETLPRYSVLVALHKESDVLPQLVAALDHLVWPRSKLEIKLVCEADDEDTLGTSATIDLPPHFEIIEVMPGLPRTKPKALNYALPLIRGEFVVLYDAEDRPHPLQLLEAWRRFEHNDADLACLQAPLQITNGADGVLARLFAFEYSALFRGLLPWLSGKVALLPLGGTSNHIRVAALQAVGGWDPYNVTEDADLGARFARFGYRTETILLPTLEDAPLTKSVWIPQRTRWFKGWIQSYLVHMREPILLFRQIGPRSFAVLQILFAGLVLSALFHPLLILVPSYIAVHLTFGGSMTQWQLGLLALDIGNIACGYLAFLLLGWSSLPKAERRGFWKIVVRTPSYWMLLSRAAWRSVWKLCRDPHQWEKTPHARVHPGRAIGPK